jgi:hypothetical protein
MVEVLRLLPPNTWLFWVIVVLLLLRWLPKFMSSTATAWYHLYLHVKRSRKLLPLRDRRLGTDRRSGHDRRVRDVLVTHERRTGIDRRQRERRMTPATLLSRM